MSEVEPILYSFRRCPYAMRARVALLYAGIRCTLREVDFKDKPAHLLEVSPKGTVPVLILPDDTVIDESLDIVDYALSQHDPEGWQSYSDEEEKKLAQRLINFNDSNFKKSLDRYKYPSRYPDEHNKDLEAFSLQHRDKVVAFLQDLDALIKANGFLVKSTVSKADIAIFPFIRQFVNVEKEWFMSLKLGHLATWLDQRLESNLFDTAMHKYPVWDGHTVYQFPTE